MNRSEKWDLRYLDSACAKHAWSKDPSSSVGAVLVDDSGECAQGYNGFPRGVEDTGDRYGDRSLKYKFVVHAEANCLCAAARRGTRTQGTTMYVDGLLTCSSCAGLIIQAGVSRVVMRTRSSTYRQEWVDEFYAFSAVMFREAGVEYRLYHDNDVVPETP